MEIDYRQFIKQLTADILNGKKTYTDITSNRDYLYIQCIFSKMGHIDRVIEMGRLMGIKNRANGIDINAATPTS